MLGYPDHALRWTSYPLTQVDSPLQGVVSPGLGPTSGWSWCAEWIYLWIAWPHPLLSAAWCVIGRLLGPCSRGWSRPYHHCRRLFPIVCEPCPYSGLLASELVFGAGNLSWLSRALLVSCLSRWCLKNDGCSSERLRIRERLLWTGGETCLKQRHSHCGWDLKRSQRAHGGCQHPSSNHRGCSQKESYLASSTTPSSPPRSIASCLPLECRHSDFQNW